MTNPQIIYFHHCNKIIFTLNCVNMCPLCLENLNSVVFISLSYPFNKASEFPAAILLKPTQGDFLNSYVEDADLHIAVTTSAGEIVEYDACGLRKSDSSNWQQCLIVFQVNEIWNEHWDSELANYFSKTDWSAQAYDELSRNCYSFVLSFLRLLGVPELSGVLGSKNLFCEKLILPKTKNATKYISVYRKLQTQLFSF